MNNLLEAKSPKESNSPYISSQWLLLAPLIEVETHGPLPHSCWNFNWLDFVVTAAAVSWCVWQPCYVQNSALCRSPPSLALKFLNLPIVWSSLNQGWWELDIDDSSTTEHSELCPVKNLCIYYSPLQKEVISEPSWEQYRSVAININI